VDSRETDTPAFAHRDRDPEARKRRVIGLGNPTPTIYEGHPLLDPFVPRREPGLARLWAGTRRRLQREGDTTGEFLSCLSHPEKDSQAPCPSLDSHLRDADSYLDDVLRLVPDPVGSHLRPLPGTRASNDPAELLHVCFEGADPRARYEAQRKLYLGKLLFAIDHCRSVRDGQRHKEVLQAHLERSLLAGALTGPELEVCCLYVPGEGGRGRLEVGVERSADARCWRFRVVRLPAASGEPGVDVFHYRCRFKRDTVPVTPTRTDEGYLQLAEAPRWPSLGRRSGSILSKMISRGIADPHLVQDVLGVMFIVSDCRQAYALERRLLHVLGGPGRVRDRIDTLAGDRERHRLTRRSSAGFRVLKETVDVLTDDPAAATPYLFAVELQIYPLEAYLETIHDAHYASHAAYKRRQFLFDLLPLLFPTSIYGDHAAVRPGHGP
jgi:hypothetical protein